MMTQLIEIDNLQCRCCQTKDSNRVAYILYPMDMLSDWIVPATKRYGVTIIVATGMDWQNVLSPWAAPGVPKGTPDFKGESPEFLNLLQSEVIPKIEDKLGFSTGVERTLIGVSMSGLFALWQWMECDTFENIASLSGSFWYDGFVDWMKNLNIPRKPGNAFFLLGNQESKSSIKEFSTVGKDTDQIMTLLKNNGIDVEFESVPGNHYADPVPRLDKAFMSLYGKSLGKRCSTGNVG